MASEVPVLNHLGVIMDGNRRAARRMGREAHQGHDMGMFKFREMSHFILTELRIPYLSAYAFSAENWGRNPDEVAHLMALSRFAIAEFTPDYHANGIRLVRLGNRDRLDEETLAVFDQAEALTADNTQGTLAICFNYGGKQEIVDAFNNLRSENCKARVDWEDIRQAIYHPEIPDVDLILRSSGESRISGFMLPRMDYAEIMILRKNWPEIKKRDIAKAVKKYQRRQRRFGK